MPEDKRRPPVVNCVCVRCGQPVGIYGGYLKGEAEWDGTRWKAPVATMWGSYYTHADCKPPR
jgi:hypothetical protein